jgi:hypothetical protein
VHHPRDDGWRGVWVNSFGPRELRSEWFPTPAAKTLAETGAPDWAVEAFERLRAANGGTLGGFFDVFAWREPGQVRFCEAKVGPDRIKSTQIRFLEVVLRFHRPADFMIIEVAGPPMPAEARRKPKSAWQDVEQDRQRPMAEQLRSDGQGLLRRVARDLLRMLDGVTAPDEPETRETLRPHRCRRGANEVLAARMTDLGEGWPAAS